MGREPRGQIPRRRAFVRRPSQTEKLVSKCLTVHPCFCMLSLELAASAFLGDFWIRAMRSYQSYFAFTYRFSWWGKRPGETRADDASK